MKYEFTYAIFQNDKVVFESTAEVSLTKKNLTEMEEFIKEHNYAWEFVDIPGHIYDKCMNMAYEKALKEYPDFADTDKGYGLILENSIPETMLEQMSDETQEKVYANIPEEFFEGADEDETEEMMEEEEFPEPTKENTLYLTIKQSFFDQIIEGVKKEEYRVIKETTYKRYLEVDEANFPIYLSDLVHDKENIEDGEIFVWNEGEYPYWPKDIYYLDLAVGYNMERDTAKVKVEDITYEPAKFPTGEPMRFVVDENNAVSFHPNGHLCLWQIVYHLGDVVEVHRKGE